MDFDKGLNLYAESVRVNYEFNELKNELKKAKAANNESERHPNTR